MTATVFEFFTGTHFTQIKGTPLPPEDWQWRGTCPFCNKKDHFFHGPGPESMWDCKGCQLRGNVYTFLKHIHSEVCTTELVSIFAMERGIDHSVFVRNQVKYNPLVNAFVVPTTNSKGALNYLYKIIQTATNPPKRQVLNTPSIDAALFNWPEVIQKTVWLTEGLMDKLAAEDIVGDRPITVVGMPGSNFKPVWCNVFSGRDLVILMDNDPAGERHLRLVLDRIASSPHKPESIRAIKWSEGLKTGYDVNDILNDHKFNAFKYITSNLIEKDIEGTANTAALELIADPTCKSFEDLTKSCETVYYYTKDMEILTHLLITAIYALKIEGEQIWVRVIGPPGSSKTTLAKLVGTSDQTILRSTFTGLLSGWKDDDPNDASLIPLIAGKALIVKDADALLQQPNKEQIFSQLRDFYDKDTSATYLNRVNYEYHNIRSAFIFCGTHALRGMDNSALGERFIDFELRVTQLDREQIAEKMLDRTIEAANSGINPESKIHAKAKNLIDNIILTYEGAAFVGPEERPLIKQYGQLIAYMRAKVERNRMGEVSYKPYAEVPSRLVGQFTKLFQCAPIPLGLRKADDRTHTLVRRIALDVVDTHSYRFAIAHFLCKAGAQSMSQLVEATALPVKIVERELDNMRLLDMLNIKTAFIGTSTAVHLAQLKGHIETQMQLITNGEI